MQLDRYLFNLLQQSFEATGNPVEERRIEELVLSHLEKRKRISRGTALRMWAVLLDAFGIPDTEQKAPEARPPAAPVSDSLAALALDYLEAAGSVTKQELIKSKALAMIRNHAWPVRPLQLNQATAIWAKLVSSFERS